MYLSVAFVSFMLLRQATTKKYLGYVSVLLSRKYAKEDMKLALRKLKDIKRGVYRLEQWESDMKNNLPKPLSMTRRDV